MAQYLISVLDTQSGLATDDEMSAIDSFNKQLRTDGHWVFACGLAAPSAAAVIDGRGDIPQFINGPHDNAPEYVSGFWVIEAADRDEALRLAVAGSKCCNRKVELRPFYGS